MLIESYKGTPPHLKYSKCTENHSQVVEEIVLTNQDDLLPQIFPVEPSKGVNEILPINEVTDVTQDDEQHVRVHPETYRQRVEINSIYPSW